MIVARGTQMPGERGTKMPGVRRVEVVTPGGASLTIETPGGVYLWPNGYLTVYRKEDVNSGWEIYGPEAVFRIFAPA